MLFLQEQINNFVVVKLPGIYNHYQANLEFTNAPKKGNGEYKWHRQLQN
jgi:hypothetical protein